MLSRTYLLSRFYEKIKFLITIITIGTMFAHRPRKFFLNASLASMRLYCISKKLYGWSCGD